jgi:hypothetical protein
MKILPPVFALLILTAFGDASTAYARTLNFMNSQGYQNQLAASRKAYADAVAAQSAPQAVSRTSRKKKAPKQ